MIDIKNNLFPIQGEGRVERIGHVQVVERQAFMHRFDQIEAGVVYRNGTAMIVAVRWSTMAPHGSEIRPVNITDFPELVLPHFPPDYVCPFSNEVHKQLIGLH